MTAEDMPGEHIWNQANQIDAAAYTSCEGSALSAERRRTMIELIAATLSIVASLLAICEHLKTRD